MYLQMKFFFLKLSLKYVNKKASACKLIYLIIKHGGGYEHYKTWLGGGVRGQGE